MNLNLQSWVAPAIIILVVVVINVGLIYALRSKNTGEQLDLLRKAGQSARNPWQKEDARLKELSEKVAHLQKSENHSDSPPQKEK